MILGLAKAIKILNNIRCKHVFCLKITNRRKKINRWIFTQMWAHFFFPFHLVNYTKKDGNEKSHGKPVYPLAVLKFCWNLRFTE